MRFMVLVKMTEPAAPPSSALIAEMGAFNQRLMEAGVVMGGEGLLPSAHGAKVRRTGGRNVIVDGPFAEAKEILGGFWILKVVDRAELDRWLMEIPLAEGEEVEVRRIAEMDDFTRDEVSAEALDREAAWRERSGQRD